MLTKKGHQLSLLLEIHRVLVLKLWLLLLRNLGLLLLWLISSAIEASLVHTVLLLEVRILLRWHAWELIRLVTHLLLAWWEVLLSPIIA